MLSIVTGVKGRPKWWTHCYDATKSHPLVHQCGNRVHIANEHTRETEFWNNPPAEGKEAWVSDRIWILVRLSAYRIVLTTGAPSLRSRHPS